MLLEQLLSQEGVKNCAFAFAWPDTLHARTRTAATTLQVKRLFASAGFRRVGRTCWVALALHDQDHPSKSLSIEEDATERDFDNFSLLTEEQRAYKSQEEQRDMNLAIIQERYPLQFAIVNHSDAFVTAKISECLRSKPECINIRDRAGITPLGLAVNHLRRVFYFCFLSVKDIKTEVFRKT